MIDRTALAAALDAARCLTIADEYGYEAAADAVLGALDAAGYALTPTRAMTGVEAVNLRVKVIEAEARADALRELAGPLRELAAVLNAIRSDGPVMDTLTAEGPWWTPPDPTGVRLHDAIIGASDAVDAVIAAIDRRLEPG